jgi:hypothetical protein
MIFVQQIVDLLDFSILPVRGQAKLGRLALGQGRHLETGIVDHSVPPFLG